MAYQMQTNRKIVLAILALLAIGCQIILESTRSEKRVRGYTIKSTAVELANDCFEALRVARVRQVGDVDLSLDPAGTGLIGPRLSSITNSRGRQADKRTALNPNFAAILVDYFQQIGLKEGDPVAVAMSGSWPGWNVNLYAALQAMELRPVIIHSVGTSNYGASDPEFTWLDMERVLAEENLISFRTAAATPGGSDDMGNGLTAEGLEKVWEIIERNGIQPLRTENLYESIERRMEIYRQGARGGDTKAYVNIGGGLASLGSPLTEVPISTGLHLDLWKLNFPRSGTLVHMAKLGTPVIQLGNPRDLARAYELPIAPSYMPVAGEGHALGRPAYDTRIAVVLLIVYLGLTLGLTLPALRDRFMKKAAA